MALITITGGVGSGIEKIANLVSRKTKLELFDDKRLAQEAVKMGIRSEDLKGMNEKAPGFFDSLFHTPELYLDLLESVVYAVSGSGQGIIIGHGSQILLREFGCAFHVLIHASDAFRVEQVMQNLGLRKDSAEKVVQKSDNERRGFLRYAFQMDWNDPSLYDLVVNTEKLGIEGGAELIEKALGLQVLQECSLNALETMQRMTLLKKVQAALLKARIGSRSFFNIESPENGTIEITGFATSDEQKKAVMKIVKGVPGVVKVKGSLGVLPPSGA
ncbi:MAG: cytidylate kinase-like family protein [Deltaproteobacteria bacterium]|nr:cytidylate kinase-like family protein [Deltaproteobacteria bacterium]